MFGPRFLLLLFFGLPTLCLSSLSTHKYEKGERVELFLNKIGPYANPQENYAYYNLPFCHPEDVERPVQEVLCFEGTSPVSTTVTGTGCPIPRSTLLIPRRSVRQHRRYIPD